MSNTTACAKIATSYARRLVLCMAVDNINVREIMACVKSQRCTIQKRGEQYILLAEDAIRGTISRIRVDSGEHA